MVYIVINLTKSRIPIETNLKACPCGSIWIRLVEVVTRMRPSWVVVVDYIERRK